MAPLRRPSGQSVPLAHVQHLLLLVLVGGLLLLPAARAQQEGCRVAADLVIMLDGSGSVESNGQQGWAKQLNFTLDFIDEIDSLFFGDVRVGFGWFAGSPADPKSSIEAPLSLGSDFDGLRNTVRNSYDKHPDGHTPTEVAAQLAQEQFELHGRPNITRMLVLLSDGQPTRPGLTDPDAAAEALAAIENLKGTHNVRVLSVSIQTLDNDAGTIFMHSAASAPKEVYSHTLTSFDDLSAILQPATTASCLQIDALSKNCGLIQHQDEIIITGKYLYDLTNDGRLMKCRFQFGSNTLLSNALPVPGANGTAVICEVPWYDEPAVAWVEVTIDGRVFTNNRLTFEYVTDLAKCLKLSETSQKCLNATKRVVQVVGTGLRPRSFDPNDYLCRFRDTAVGLTSQTFGTILHVARNVSRTVMLCDSPDWANANNQLYPNPVDVDVTINAGANWAVNALTFKFPRLYDICPRPIDGGEGVGDEKAAPLLASDGRCLVGALPCWAFGMIVGVLISAVLARSLWAYVGWRRMAAKSQQQWTLGSQHYSWTETDMGSTAGAAPNSGPRTLVLDFSNADSAPDAAPTPSNRRLRVAETRPDGTLVLERYQPGFFDVCCPSIVLCCSRYRTRLSLARQRRAAGPDAAAGAAAAEDAEANAAPDDSPFGSTITPGDVVDVDFVPMEADQDTLLMPLSPRAAGGAADREMDFV